MSKYTRALSDNYKLRQEYKDLYRQKKKEYDLQKVEYDKAESAFKVGTTDAYNSLSDSAKTHYDNIDNIYQKQIKDEQARQKAERDEMGWLERTAHTVGDVLGNAVGGFLKFGENIVDAGATIFGADEEWIKKDRVGDGYGKLLKEGTKGSYLNDSKAGEITRNVANSVGNMLPSVLLNAVPVVGTGLSSASFVANASGGGIEKALQEGATREKALGYGALSGLTEGAIEAISGGIGGVGKGIAQSVGKGAIKSVPKTGFKAGAKKVIGNMIGEGLEEVASDAIDPLYKAMYTGKIDYSDTNFLDTFAIGALSGGVMQGGQKLYNRVNPQSDFRNKLAEINEIKHGIDENFAKGKLTAEQYNVAMEDINYLVGQAQKGLIVCRIPDRTKYMVRLVCPKWIL